jgi:hypothetical protein
MIKGTFISKGRAIMAEWILQMFNVWESLMGPFVVQSPQWSLSKGKCTRKLTTVSPSAFLNNFCIKSILKIEFLGPRIFNINVKSISNPGTYTLNIFTMVVNKLKFL